MIDIKITPNKNQDKNTTSHKFKQDLVEFFHGKELESCLEIGTNRGYSTLILSQLFGWVTTLEINRENIEFAKEVCKERKNIEFLQHDVCFACQPRTKLLKPSKKSICAKFVKKMLTFHRIRTIMHDIQYFRKIH